MSADDWDVCPSCLTKARDEWLAKTDHLSVAYGKIPLDEFDALRDDVAKGINEEDFRTFREDYEFYLDGFTLHVSYSGHCTECSTGLDLNEEHKIPQTERSK